MEGSPGKPVSFHLRGKKEEDEAFLLELYSIQQRAIMANWGWGPSQQKVFLELQFRARESSYMQHYPEAAHRIICLQNGTRIGRLLTAELVDCIHLVDLAILPEHQRQRIGTRILSDLQSFSADKGKYVTLYIANDSYARKLYERLGFHLVSQDPVYAQMEWAA